VVCGPLIGAQWQFGGDFEAVQVGAAMCVAFLLTGPWLWRACFPLGRPVALRALRALVYGLGGLLVIYGTGAVLPRVMDLSWTFLTDTTSLLVLLALYWVGGWGLGRDIDLEAQLVRERARVEALAQEKEQAQLLALRAHLDPHFLFNTLNAIAEWCREDPAVAEAAIVRLAGMLRTMLGALQADAWSLERELALCGDVAALYQVRDPERFRFRQEGEVPELALPPLLLLPLIENAMTHGPAAGHAGEVVLTVTSEATELTLTLVNPGSWTGPRDGGHGIPTVRRRLALRFGEAATLSHRALDGPRTETVLRLPLEER